MGHELDRKLESLERLQVLLQSHTSPKNGENGSSTNSRPAVPGTGSTSTTPTRRDTASRSLSTVVERGESVEALEVGQASLSRSRSGKSSKTFNCEEDTPATVTDGTSAPVSEMNMSQKISSFAPTVETTSNSGSILLPRVKLSPWEQKKADEDRLSQRKGLLSKVNADIRNTLSSLSLPPHIDVS